MNKITALALAGLVAVSSFAGATDSRSQALGSGQRFVSDVKQMWELPTRLLENKDAAFVELGQGDISGVGNGVDNDIEVTPWGGANISLFGGVVGVWLNRPVDEFKDSKKMSKFRSYGLMQWSMFGSGFVEFFAGVPNQNAEQNNEIMDAIAPGSRVDLLYGWSFSDKLDLTVGVNRAFFDFKTIEPGSTQYHFANNSTGLLLGAAIKDPFIHVSKLDLGASFQSQSLLVNIENYFGGYDQGTTTEGRSMILSALADLSSDKSKISKVKGYYRSDSLESREFGMEDSPVNGHNPAELVTVNHYGLSYGVGKSDAKSLGLVGVIYNYEERRLNRLFDNLPNNPIVGQDIEEEKESKFILVASGEAKAKEWLVLRGGVDAKVGGSKSVYSVDSAGYYGGTSGKDTEIKEYPDAAKLSTGFGFLLGDFTIDTTFNRDFLYTGPFLLSSSGDALINTNVSVTMDFGGSKE